MIDELSVLFDGGDVLVVDKPTGIPTEPDRERRQSLRDEVEAWLARRGRRARVPHAVSRLDTGVSGATVFAVTDAGVARMAGLTSRGGYRRAYVGLAAGVLPPRGRWSAPVRGREAVTDFEVVARAAGAAVEIALFFARPRTGRTHQIRAHASAAGAPLAGDRRYGGPTSVAVRGGRIRAVPRPMLHALCVSIPTQAGDVAVVAPIPDEMRAFWTALDGAPEAWEDAFAACDGPSSPAS